MSLKLMPWAEGAVKEWRGGGVSSSSELAKLGAIWRKGDYVVQQVMIPQVPLECCFQSSSSLIAVGPSESLSRTQ